MKSLKSENKCSSLKKIFPSDIVSANGVSSHRNLMLCRLELLLLSFVAIFQKPEINQLNVAASGGKNGNECRIERRRRAEKIDIFFAELSILSSDKV